MKAKRIFLFIALGLAAAATQGIAQTAEEPKTFPEVKVALLGDTEAGTGFASVLKLVTAEKANVVVINGDFGYYSSPSAWQKKLTTSIDINAFPIIGALGNHDIGVTATNAYIKIFDDLRTPQNGLKSKCSGIQGVSEGHDIVAVDEVCNFENVSIVENAIGQVLSTTYLENRLDAKLKSVPQGNWSLVGYHFTLASMNPGLKSDQATYRFFEIIRKYGAIGVQAHTHSVMASCPISSVFAKGTPVACHSEFGSNLEDRFIMPGTSVFLDSSVGGKEVRPRGRCQNPNDTDCRHMVDLITQEGYTRTDGVSKAKFNGLGAMFLVFNVGGDPSKALGYFKSIDGQQIFQFQISR